MRSGAGARTFDGSGAQGSTRSCRGLAQSPDSRGRRGGAGGACTPVFGVGEDTPRGAGVELSHGSVSSKFRSSTHSTRACRRLAGAAAALAERAEDGATDGGDHGSTTQSLCANATPAPARIADTTKIPTRIWQEPSPESLVGHLVERGFERKLHMPAGLRRAKPHPRFICWDFRVRETAHWGASERGSHA